MKTLIVYAHPEPKSLNGSLKDSWFNIDVVARLAPGATPEMARQTLTAYYATLARSGANGGHGANGNTQRRRGTEIGLYSVILRCSVSLCDPVASVASVL